MQRLGAHAIRFTRSEVARIKLARGCRSLPDRAMICYFKAGELIHTKPPCACLSASIHLASLAQAWVIREIQP